MITEISQWDIPIDIVNKTIFNKWIIRKMYTYNNVTNNSIKYEIPNKLYYYNNVEKKMYYDIPLELLDKNIFNKWKIGHTKSKYQYYYNIQTKKLQWIIPDDLINIIIFNKWIIMKTIDNYKFIYIPI
jgi:hypothetical protein